MSESWSRRLMIVSFSQPSDSVSSSTIATHRKAEKGVAERNTSTNMAFCTKCRSCWICLEYHEGSAHEGAGCRTLSSFHRLETGKVKPALFHRIDLPHGNLVNLGELSRTCDRNREL
jgi:hypothetical protein